MSLRYLTLVLSVCAVTSFVVGCDRTSNPTFTSTPTLAGGPDSDVPLATIISATTDEPTVLLIQVSDGESEWQVPAPAELATQHAVPALGFRPDRKHLITVIAQNAAGKKTAAVPLEFNTGPLPDYFPRLELLISKPEKMEPGVTLFALMRWPDGRPPDEEFGLAVAVDEQGEVVWYRQNDPTFEDPHRIASGNLLQIVGYHRAEEVDMLGNLVASWHASKHPNPEPAAGLAPDSIPVAVETIHHDIQEMPSGNLLTLSTEMRVIDDYPTSLDDVDAPTAPANVIGDVVVEFARDGSIVNEWKLMDLLDTTRLGYESVGRSIWDQWAYVDVEGGTQDWSHANSVVYAPETDSIVVSLRHQEAVISFSRATGELNWILGSHEGWAEQWQPYLLQPEGEFEWQFHQHAAEVTSRGTLLLFDNGNFRALPPETKTTVEASYSRAVEYAIDTESETVRQVWSYGGPGKEHFFSPFISEADQLPATGNVLITDGGRVSDEQGQQSDQIVGGRHRARIVEVTYPGDPEKVFEITVNAREDDPYTGWAVYRSDRLPSLYSN